MGCFSSKPCEQSINSFPPYGNSGKKGEDLKDIEVLLLGAPRSGKSTILKQMHLLHDSEGFSQEYVELSTKVIISNTLNSMYNILEFMTASDPNLTSVSTQVRADIGTLLELKDKSLKSDITPNPYHWDCIKRLWKNDKVRESFEMFDYNEHYLQDLAGYFLDNLSRIRDPCYIPSSDDMLRFYLRTTGFSEFSFIPEKNDFDVNIVDLGSEHKRWVHCLKDFRRETILVFCVGLSDYNLMLFSDKHSNRLHHSLNLLGSLLDKYITENDVPLLLFLNKVDLFEEKLRKYPLSLCFPEYEGYDDFEEACQFIESKFRDIAENRGREIHVHYVCATDLNSGSAIWNAISARSSRITEQHL